MAKFLITGGAGFIGGNYLNIMVNKYPDDMFVCVDCLTYAGNIETLKQIMNCKNFKFIRQNICNKEEMFKIFNQESFDYVINFAGESDVDRSIVNPEIFFKTNTIGTLVLLEACRIYGIKRFHQISTDEVYGDISLDNTDLIFDEKSPLRASNPYSISKASADLLALSFYRTFHLPITISRCTNNYGPFQHPEKLIPLIITKAKNLEKIPLFGDGLNVRDWIYVADHCNAIDLIVRYGTDGEIYNISSNNERTNLEVAKTIIDFLEKDERLITFVKDRPGHDLKYALNSDKIKKEMHWKPNTEFNDGIAYTIKWYLENYDWTCCARKKDNCD